MVAKSSHEDFERSRSALKEGKMQEAIECFRLSPSTRDASLLIAECWRRGRDIEEAFEVIHTLTARTSNGGKRKPDLAVFRALLNACLKVERPERNRDVLRLMERHSVFPDEACFGMLTASLERIRDVGVVREMAEKLLEVWKSSKLVIKERVPDIYANRLVQAFGRVQDMQRAFEAFRQRGPSSSALFGAFARACLACGHPENALPLWNEMLMKGVEVDTVCFSALCRACGETGDVVAARELLFAISGGGATTEKGSGSCWDTMVVGNSKLSFQASHLQCAQLIKAFCVRTTDDNQAGMANELIAEAYGILELMVRSSIPIESAHGYVALLKGCATHTALSMGRRVHAHVLRYGSPILQKDTVLLAALITMYVKCAELSEGERIFEDAIGHGVSPTVEMWTALIQGMALFGHAKKALALLKRMQERDHMKPNDVTFVALLMACSHAVQPDDALSLLALMKDMYRMEPNAQHYTCVVDALGRANRIREAYELILGRPSLHEDAVVWQALLGSCKLFQNTEIGAIAAMNVRRLDAEDTSNYVLLGNMMAAAGRHLDKWKEFEEMKQKGLKKIPAACWIEVDGKCHRFRAHEQDHPAMGSSRDGSAS